MNILQFNVRLAEGGAAGVALDLHQRALQQGLASHFVYGYGKGGKESVSHQNYPQVIKHTPRMTAMANIALFRLFNRDLFGNFNELYRTITRTPGPVVLHFHVLHSYWLNLNSVVRFCEKVKNHKPDVTTGLDAARPLECYRTLRLYRRLRRLENGLPEMPDLK